MEQKLPHSIPKRFRDHGTTPFGVKSTRVVAAAQPAGAPFTTTPAVNTWSCTCGFANPPRAQHCRRCGQERSCPVT